MYNTYKLCNRHFEDSQFIDVEQKSKLQRNAVPTVFPENPTIYQPDPITPPRKSPKPRSMTTPHRKERKCLKMSNDKTREFACQVSDVENNLKIRKLKRTIALKNSTIKNLKGKVRELQKQIETFKAMQTENLAYQNLPPIQKDFIKTQLDNSSKPRKRYPPLIKYLSLSVYFKSPAAYKVLSNTFQLPSVSGLKRIVCNYKLSPGLDNDFLKDFRRLNQFLKPAQRIAVLVLDGMTIKPHLSFAHHLDNTSGFEDYGKIGSTKKIANNVLVIMARGITSNWKQPLAYFPYRNTIKPEILFQILENCIQLSEQFGYDIGAITFDQEINQINFVKRYQINEQHPYLNTNINNYRKPSIIFDPPHLLKNCRNNLMNYDIAYDGRYAI